jgi:DNA-binding FrmR family transcriptional regulator
VGVRTAESNYRYSRPKVLVENLPLAVHLPVVEAADGSLEQDNRFGRVPGDHMMQLHNEEAKKILKARLSKLEGQVRGVQSMLDDNRDCVEIIQQLSSIKSAVQSASAYFLREYTTDCVQHLNPADPQSNRQAMNDLIGLLSKMP